MPLDDVGALGGFILQSAAKIQELGENWYRASEEWHVNFPHTVENLRQKLSFWEAECRKLRISRECDEALVQSLLTAKLLLEREEAKLEKGNRSCSRGCRPKLSMTVFPARLGLKIQSALRAFDEIPELMNFQKEVRVLLHDRVINTPTSVQILSDDRYVSLRTTEKRVCEALGKPGATNKDEGPAVVLLHGAAGKGKSTLARYVAGVYYKKIENKSVFDIVNILSCGRDVNIEAKENELLQLLGGDPAAVEDLETEQAGRKVKIRKELSLLLMSEQKILLVLDDVWHAEFLQKFLELCGSGVKCLVTSRDKTLCHKLNCSRTDAIQIEDVGDEDARKLLASHLRLLDHRIPDELMDIADKMIHQTQNNPLALASLASAIDVDQSTDRKEWVAASEDLFSALRSKETALIFNVRYPQSFVATMHLTMDNLPPQAQQLLFLTSMFKDLYVPEEIISTFYRSPNIQGDTRTFLKFKNKLQYLQLVKIKTERSSSGPGVENRKSEWSFHSLQKEFLTRECVNKVESLFESLVDFKQVRSANEETDSEEEITEEERNSGFIFVTTLCAVYFCKKFAKRALLKRGIKLKYFESRLDRCKSFVDLLELPASELWTEKSKAFTRQIILKLARPEGVLDDDNALAHLLLQPASTRVALRALWDSTLDQSGKTRWRTLGIDSMRSSVTALVTFLAEGVDEYIQRRSVVILNKISTLCTFDDFSPSPCLFEGLVRMLGNRSCSEFQRADCANTLVNLATKAALASRVVEYPGVFDSMVELSLGDGKPHLQGVATRALSVFVHLVVGGECPSATTVLDHHPTPNETSYSSRNSSGKAVTLLHRGAEHLGIHRCRQLP